MIVARAADGASVRASPGATASCPACREPLIPRCGRIVTWHWAHRAADCDPWAEPESAWHLGWKARGYVTEEIRARGSELHRADIVTPDGWVVELQTTFLPADTIAARERFYGQRMVWLYRAEPWLGRLHFGKRGFWWKHGAKSMATHQRPVYWDTGGEIWLVRVTVIDRIDSFGDAIGQRVLGKITGVSDPDTFARRLTGDTPR